MPDSPKTTARSLLADWANQQDSWVRSLVGELLATRSPIGTESLQRTLDMLLAEKGLGVELLPQPLPNVKDPGSTSGEQAALRLEKLTEVAHVNALTARQEIEFHPSLTILFGENAAGKSGYCRILKRLANVRSAEEILDDVESQTRGIPTATIKYALGNEQHELKWDNSPGVAPFGRVAVFDSRAVGLHVDDDLNYQYTPSDLVLFRLCHSAVESLKRQLDVVSLETAPRTDSLSRLKATINEKLQEANKAGGAARQALVESAYASLRAWCEVAVETQLLKGVVTRYQPMVRLTTLDQIKHGALKAATDAIVPVYERACRAIEAHSQPLETLNVRPTLDGLRQDWDTVQQALKAYEKA